MTTSDSEKTRYINLPNLNEARALLDKHYDPEVEWTDLRKGAFRKGGAKDHGKHDAWLDCYWGRCIDGRIEIGVRGKITALCWLQSRLRTTRAGWQTLAEAIADYAPTSQLGGVADAAALLRGQYDLRSKAADDIKRANFQKRHGDSKAKDTGLSVRLRRECYSIEGQLSLLMSTAQAHHGYEVDDATLLLKVTAGFFASELFSGAIASGFKTAQEVYEAIIEIASHNYTAPSEFARKLAHRLGLRTGSEQETASQRSSALDASSDTRPIGIMAPTAQPANAEVLHHIDDEILTYVRDNKEDKHGASSFTDLVGKIHAQATNTIQRVPTRLLVITGPQNAGKKAVVGELISKISGADLQSDTIFLRLGSHSAEPIALPVFAVNTRGRDYFTLMVEVLVFLKRCNEARLPADKRPGEFHLTFAARLKAECDALAADPHKFDTVLGEIERAHVYPAFFILMDVHGSLSDSILKILNNYGIIRLLRSLLRNEASRILVTDQEPQAVTVYKNVEGERIVESFQVAAPDISRLRWYGDTEDIRDLIDGLSRGLRRVPISGAGLVLLSALHVWKSPSPDHFRQLVETYLKAANERPSDEATDPQLKATKILCAEFLRRCAEAGCLELMALVCASEDGVTDTTFDQAIRHWPDSRWLKEKRSVPDLAKSLHEVVEASKGRLLRHGPVLRSDAHEYLFDENVATEKWEVNRQIARAAFAVLEETPEWQEIAVTAYRQIAIAARRRAQTKKMLSDTNGPDPIATARDIQSYVALLHSIPVSTITERLNPKNITSLRLSSHLVFTHDLFDPRTALRFAVRCQLREDIDYDFRLTMVSDQDELRLKLYLLPFTLQSDRNLWSVGDLREPKKRLKILKSEIPAYFRNSFTDREILDHLVSVALTGFHCQFNEIVRWANERADELSLGCDTSTSWWMKRISRIRCSQLDMQIQRGELREAIGHVEEWLGGFPFASAAALKKSDATITVTAQEIDEHDIEVLKAWMRLTARYAELSWLTGDRSKAARYYDELYRLENELADKLDQEDPIILSGRTARRYLRFLMAEAPIYRTDLTEEQPIPVSDATSARHLQDINISRLRRFGGADRVGVLIDMARRHYDEKEAWQYADLAMDLTFSSSVSHGGKLDVLSVSASLHLLRAERLRGKRDQSPAFAHHLSDAVRYAHLLQHLAKALNFQPALATSHYLLARAAFAEYEHWALTKEQRYTKLSEANAFLIEAVLTAEGFAGYSAVALMKPLEQLINSRMKRSKGANGKSEDQGLG